MAGKGTIDVKNSEKYLERELVKCVERKGLVVLLFLLN